MNNVLDHGHLTVKHINNFEAEIDLNERASKEKEEPLNPFTISLLSVMTFQPADVDAFDDAVITSLERHNLDKAAHLHKLLIVERNKAQSEVRRQAMLVENMERNLIQAKAYLDGFKNNLNILEGLLGMNEGD